MRKKLLKISSLSVTVFAMAIMFAACGGSASDEATAQPEAQQQTEEPAQATEEDTAEIKAPESIEEWYGEYTSDKGTLSITSSIEDMINYEFNANDDSYMSGTWKPSLDGIGVMEDSYLTVTYNAADGTVNVTGKTAEDNESNASFIGVYTPVSGDTNE